jgi:putative PEP-CTERM system TPR-repeat lipoprotein
MTNFLISKECKMKILLTCVFTLSLLMSSCTKSTTEEYIAQAKSQIASNEPLSAVVLLKNAILNDASDAQARLMLGKVYVSLGKVLLAEKELSVALKLGADPNEVVPLVAKTLSMQSKYAEISDLKSEFVNLTTEANAALRFYDILGLLKQGYRLKAKNKIKFIDKNSTDKYDQLLRIYSLAVDSNIDKAIFSGEALIRQYEKFDDAYFILGQLYSLEKDFLNAENMYRNYVKIQPEYLYGRFYLADVLVKNGKYNDAREHLEILLRADEDQPYANQLLGMIEFESKNYELAFVHSRKAIDNGLSNYTNDLVAGLSSFQLNNMEQAYDLLRKIQDKIPAKHFSRNIFVSVLMHLGYSDEAAELVKELGQSEMIDSGLLTSLGMNLLQKGEKEKALEVISLVEQDKIQNPTVLTKLGFFKQLVGDTSSIDLLEKSLALDGSLQQTKIVILNDFMLQEKQDEAIDFAKKWISEEPYNIVPLNLVASILIKQKQLEAAEEFLNGALKIIKTNPLSLIYFANKEMVGGNKDASLSIIKQLVNAKPDYIQGWYAYYKLANSDKSKAELITLLSDYSEKQNNLELDTFYVQVLLSQDDLEKAKLKLQYIIENQKPSELNYELYGRVLERLNDIDNAINMYSRWRTDYPNNIRPWLFELVLYEKLERYSNGLNVLNDAKKHFPDETRFKILTAQFKILSGDIKGANIILTKLKGDERLNVISEMLEAQIYLQNKQYSKALSGFERFYEQQPIGKNALIIYEIYKKLGRVNEGKSFLENRLVNFPNDKATKAKLALEYLDTNPEMSIIYYLALINDEPNNINFLNNVSWAYHKTAKNKDALPLIERAHEINKQNISVIDTYVLTLVELGRLSEANDILNDAFKESPKNQNLLNLQNFILNKQ